MQYPITSKACHRLTKFAHNSHVTGVVRKQWSTPSDAGATAQFILMSMTDGRSLMLGISQESARKAILGLRAA